MVKGSGSGARCGKAAVFDAGLKPASAKTACEDCEDCGVVDAKSYSSGCIVYSCTAGFNPVGSALAAMQPVAAPPLSRTLAGLEGRAIVVTGATSGLGKCIAIQCAKAGARGVLVCGRSAERGMAVVDEIRSLAPGCLCDFSQGDLAEGDAVAQATVAKAVALFGTVEGLVNSAAVCFPRGTLADTTPELWDKMMKTNLTAPFLFTKAFTEVMKAARVRGAVVNIGSCAAHGGAPFILAYSCSKGGLAILTKNNAQELRGHGIRVNQVNMGWCLTDAEDAGQRAEKGPDWLADADAGSPTGRLLRTVDTSATVVHLLSEASAMITGAVVDVSPDVIPGMLPAAVG